MMGPKFEKIFHNNKVTPYVGVGKCLVIAPCFGESRVTLAIIINNINYKSIVSYSDFSITYVLDFGLLGNMS